MFWHAGSFAYETDTKLSLWAFLCPCFRPSQVLCKKVKFYTQSQCVSCFLSSLFYLLVLKWAITSFLTVLSLDLSGILSSPKHLSNCFISVTSIWTVHKYRISSLLFLLFIWYFFFFLIFLDLSWYIQHLTHPFPQLITRVYKFFYNIRYKLFSSKLINSLSLWWPSFTSSTCNSFLSSFIHWNPCWYYWIISSFSLCCFVPLCFLPA